MAYGRYKYFAKRTLSEFLRDIAFEIAINPKFYWYQRGIASVAYKFFDKIIYWNWY